MLRKIVVIGPESTGKSTLCQQLAEHYGTLWCPEYAREYLLENGMDYSYEDLLTIAKGQISLEDAYVRRTMYDVPVHEGSPSHASRLTPHNRLLFIDTDMYVMKVWCEFVYGKCHPWILEQIAERSYDLYLLCNTDLPWVKDELREYPDLATRDTLFRIYKDLMVNQSTPWVEIRTDDYEERLRQAIRAVDQSLT